MSTPDFRTHLLAGPATPAGEFAFPDGRRCHLRRLTLRQLLALSEPLPADGRTKLHRLADLVGLIVCGPDNGDAGDAAAAVTPDEVPALIEACLAANGLGKGGAEAGKGPSPATPS